MREFSNHAVFHSRPQRPRSFWSAPRNHDLWPGPTPEVHVIHGLPVTLRMLRVKSDKSDWFWFQSIVFTKPFKNRMSLDQARGRDFLVLTKRSAASGDENGVFFDERLDNGGVIKIHTRPFRPNRFLYVFF